MVQTQSVSVYERLDSFKDDKTPKEVLMLVNLGYVMSFVQHIETTSSNVSY